MALHLNAQNAGILVRHTGENVTFDCFESSALAEVTIQTKGALIRRFPGRAITIPAVELLQTGFCSELAALLRNLASERISDAAVTSMKAGSEVIEERDTTNPKYVVDLLCSLLAACGAPSRPQSIRKRIRDDVCWSSAKLPWRRSALWTTLRVCLQLACMHASPDSDGHKMYKNIIIMIVAQLSHDAVDGKVSDYLVQVISTKLARRIWKIDSLVFPAIKKYATATLQKARNHLCGSWKATQDAHSTMLDVLNITSTTDDTDLVLKSSESYLLTALSRGSGEPIPELHRLPHIGRFQPKMTMPLVFTTPDRNPAFWLFDLEHWAATKLATLFTSEANCVSLRELLYSYTDVAEATYQGDIEQTSIMLLTAMELWCAVDKMATVLFPLLLQYPCEIPSSLLEPLLLPKTSQIYRLKEIESHLQVRRAATLGFASPSLFAATTPNSFSVQFYNGSHSHQNLKTVIEAAAQADKQCKHDEWERKTAQHIVLLQNISRKACEYVMVPHQQYMERVHDRHCTKCALQNEANALRITVHEWPLPTRDYDAKAAVFELNCPSPIAAWRDVTWRIVHDLGRGFTTGGRLKTALRQYQGLSNHTKEHGHQQRLEFFSTTKSFLVSHYSGHNFPVTEDDIIVKNGLRYSLGDAVKRCWLSDQTAVPTFVPKCSTRLPFGKYKPLQDYVNQTTHTSNEVISAQSSCPAEMSIHEFIAFASLRAGDRIQWLNILLALATPDLTMNCEEVGTLISQAAWQVGPALEDDVLRTAHDHFHDVAFVDQLLGVIERNKAIVQANWKEECSTTTLVILTLRVLWLTEDPVFQVRSLKLLDEFRHTTAGWARHLSAMLGDTTDEVVGIQIQQRIICWATLCRLTYDVDDTRLVDLLSVHPLSCLFPLFPISTHNWY